MGGEMYIPESSVCPQILLILAHFDIFRGIFSLYMAILVYLGHFGAIWSLFGEYWA